MAYVAPADAEPGTILAVEIREQRVEAEVVALPFYRRGSSGGRLAGASPPPSESHVASQHPDR
jgi:hypothetical protein